MLISAVGLAACSRSVTFAVDTPITTIAPAALPPRAVVQDDAIVVWANITFVDDARIAPASFDVLDEVASLSKRHPTIKTIIVEKLQLSAARTKTLMAYLVGQGVARDVAIERPAETTEQ